MFHFGYALPNGATVILHQKDTVLALHFESPFWEYVTWKVDKDGNTFNGRYFDSITAGGAAEALAAAAADFAKRV